MQPRFITVLVEEHDDIPEGCCMRFKQVDEPRGVRLVRYDGGDSPPATVWRVVAAQEDGSTGIARAVTVEDSGAGTSILLYGGARGLRLRPTEGGATLAEPYLLLGEEAVVEWADGAT